MKELICIICPRGCHLSVDEETLAVSGNTCPRGAEYGRSEVSNPVRTVTGSVKACGGHRGDVLIADVCGTGANIISCKDM